MGRGRLNKEEIRILGQNPYVVDVSEERVVYSDEFKRRFMKEYLEGKKPKQIFQDAGFDPAILGSKRIERAGARWRESFASGTLGDFQDAVVKCHERLLPPDRVIRAQNRQIDSLQVKIKRLQEENMQLKQQLTQAGNGRI
ncbi:MAG: hypothetical protein Q4F83_05665 [Eubacteriales bacterium]|nr:hypothetical protein [Eubacteriales bacterium]